MNTPLTDDSAMSGFGAGIYVHVPCCVTKCPYCDFYSVTESSARDGFAAALAVEARLQGDFEGPFDTVYFGGGTPSSLPDEELADAVEALYRTFTITEAAEVTVEVNPDDLTQDRLRHFRNIGFNRLSLGAQALDDGALTFLGRRHTARQVFDALAWARETGFINVGMDLIYAFAGQSRAAWGQTLDAAVALEPEHLSCYTLTLEPNTAFGREHAAGRMPRQSEDEEFLLYKATSDRLTAEGYDHYEVSNFARTPAHRSRHNWKYWVHAPYLGLGPAAHSYSHGARWWNLRDVGEWRTNLEQGRPAVTEREVLSAEQLRLETILLGFRCAAGVPLSALSEAPGWEAVADELEAEGRVRRVEDRLVPTVEGYLVADRLPLRFSL